MNENYNILKSKIEEAEIVLVGIGEEFEYREVLLSDDKYQRVCNQLAMHQMEALLPYVNHYFLMKNAKYQRAFSNLANLLDGKNVFVVSTCMNGMLEESGIPLDKMVTPCGNILKLQCQEGCQDALFDVPKEYTDLLIKCIEQEDGWQEMKEHKCGVCSHEMVFNSLYAERYLEAGYLPMWSKYTTWLQGTVNKKLCVLELGVGLKYPSVIRWPFEKTVIYNNKAFFLRVHEKLSQLTPEISEKGHSIAVNAVEFLANI